MSLSLYQSSIPVFIHGFKNLLVILAKGEENAAARKIDPLVFTNGRLAPDMFPLSRQVQIATDIVKGAAARLAGVDIPKFEDTETTFAELKERVNKTIAFLHTIKADAVDVSGDKEIILKMGGHEMNFKGLPYLQLFVLPNFYFHLTTTYSILRHLGVDVGKKDFIGEV